MQNATAMQESKTVQAVWVGWRPHSASHVNHSYASQSWVCVSSCMAEKSFLSNMLHLPVMQHEQQIETMLLAGFICLGGSTC